jgi:hypothetical protein
MSKNNPVISKPISVSIIVVLLISIFFIEISDKERMTVLRDSDSTGGSSVLDDKLPLPKLAVPTARSSIPSLPKGTRSYYPNAAIKNQLPDLRDAADKGDSHAACVLSRALVLCRNAAEDLSLSRYSSHYLASLSEKEVDSFTSNLASNEGAVSEICRGINKSDLHDIGERIYQSAALGDKGAMYMFSAQSYSQDNFGEGNLLSDVLAQRHSQHAESMINDAADSGDPAALLSIYTAYSLGFIDTDSTRRVSFEVDIVKAIAAFRALLSVDDFYLKSRYSPYDFANAEKSIQHSMSMLDDADKVRLAKMEDAYIRSYRSKRRARDVSEELRNELPEQACAEIKPELGRPLSQGIDLRPRSTALDAPPANEIQHISSQSARLDRPPQSTATAASPRPSGSGKGSPWPMKPSATELRQ